MLSFDVWFFLKCGIVAEASMNPRVASLHPRADSGHHSETSLTSKWWSRNLQSKGKKTTLSS